MNNLQTNLNYQFKNPELLTLALRHRSYLNEHRQELLESNERLEFLGDAVLELWTSETLFNLFPSMKEGDLTNLRALTVRTESLAKVATTIKIGPDILLSHGEEANGGRENISILADTFEAIIGAIYIDGGFKKAVSFLEYHLSSVVKNNSQQKIYKDPKSLFQEIAQAKTGVTPHYQTLKETGPDHKKMFEVGVYIKEKLITTGAGASKQSAEEDASTKATKIINDLV